MAVYNFAGKTPREIAAMVQGIIGENLALRDPAFAYSLAKGKQIAERDPTQRQEGVGTSSGGEQNFLAAFDPKVAERQAKEAALALHDSLASPSCKCNWRPCRTQKQRATAVAAPGANSVKILGARSNRIAVIFTCASNTDSLWDTSTMLASSQFGTFFLGVRQSRELLAKDWGDFVCNEWHVMNTGGVGLTAVAVEVYTV
jgi:hypothetical protein